MLLSVIVVVALWFVVALVARKLIVADVLQSLRASEAARAE